MTKTVRMKVGRKTRAAKPSTSIIKVRLTANELKQFKMAAKVLDCTLSDWVRSVLNIESTMALSSNPNHPTLSERGKKEKP